MGFLRSPNAKFTLFEYWTSTFPTFQIVIPDLAIMRFIVNDDAGRMIGQRIIPMESIQSGYRFISLRNEFNLPIGQIFIPVLLVLLVYSAGY